MKTYQARNIGFISSDVSEEMKLIKVKGAFKCDDERAKEILEIISSNSTLDVSRDDLNGMMVFGIGSSYTSHERIEYLKQKQIDDKIAEEKLKTDLVAANKWYETLSEEEQNYVRILGNYRFGIMPAG